MNKFEILIPEMNLENLMQDSVLMRNAKKPTTKDKILDRAAYLLHIIFNQLDKNREKDIDTDSVNLCSQLLEKAVYNYKDYLRHFESKNILSLKKKHSNMGGSGYCRKYSINPLLVEGKKREYAIEESKVIKSVRSFNQEKGVKKKYSHLLKWQSQLKGPSRDSILELYEGDENRAVSQIINTERLLSQPENWTYKTDKNGRLYTNFTNVSKTIRRQITLNGEHLIGIDIKSSIPTLSILLFHHELVENTPKLLELLIQSNPKRLSESAQRNNLLRSSTDWPPSVHKYIKEILNGDIYEYMARIWFKIGSADSVPKNQRDKAKTALMKILNSPTKYHGCKAKMFEREFKVPYDTILKLNEGYYKTSKGKGKMKRGKNDLRCPFAMFFMSVEAWFVLDNVCATLKREAPNCPILPIHDAIYTTHKYVNLVRKVFEDESQRLFGFRIKVKVESRKNTNQRAA